MRPLCLLAPCWALLLALVFPVLAAPPAQAPRPPQAPATSVDAYTTPYEGERVCDCGCLETGKCDCRNCCSPRKTRTAVTKDATPTPTATGPTRPAPAGEGWQWSEDLGKWWRWREPAAQAPFQRCACGDSCPLGGCPPMGCDCPQPALLHVAPAQPFMSAPPYQPQLQPQLQPQPQPQLQLPAFAPAPATTPLVWQPHFVPQPPPPPSNAPTFSSAPAYRLAPAFMAPQSVAYGGAYRGGACRGGG